MSDKPKPCSRCQSPHSCDGAFCEQCKEEAGHLSCLFVNEFEMENERYYRLDKSERDSANHIKIFEAINERHILVWRTWLENAP